MTELSKEVLEDNQAVRALMNYIGKAVEEIADSKHTWDDINEGALHDNESVLEFIKETCEQMIVWDLEEQA